MTRASVAVDIGGTFTDVVLVRGSDVFVEKTLTTHDDLLTGFFRGVQSVLKQAGLVPGDISGRIVHATTVVTNALIERRGASSAMVFTEGFADILRIRTEQRFDIYDNQIENPAPIIDKTYTIKERAYADGTVAETVQEGDVATLASRLVADEIESVGVCFLHSYRNPSNERLFAERLQKQLPHLHISISSDVSPVIREYLRASTTAVNAYAVPITKPYLGRLKQKLNDDGFPADPLIVLSSGGLVGAATAGKYPVRMIESGPAAGALAASYLAELLSEPELLAFDMGGTTAKICLIQNFLPLISGQFEVDRMYRLKEGSGFPVSVPTIDLIEIGAGGGSIAEVGDMGLIKVGPRSAGASPGPVCYGLGGQNPTVTDACVVLGLLDPTGFLGGEMPLDGAAAEQALGDLGARVDVDAVGAARGVHRIVCEAMAGAVRAHAAERGVDYRGVPLLAFGGSGPVHACGVARLLNSRKVIFPPFASVLSAFGALVTPIRLDLVRSGRACVGEMDWASVDHLLSDLEQEGREALEQAGVPAEAISYHFSADMRYLGQHYEITVPLPGRPNPDMDLTAIFAAEYRQRHAISQDELEVEIVNWRMAAVSPSDLRPTSPISAPTMGSMRTRIVHAWEGYHSVPVISRKDFAADTSVEGPLIIEERETTLVIGPGWKASLGPLGCIIAEQE